MVNSERGEHIGITSRFENVSERNNTLHMFNTYDETWNGIPDELSELWFPETHFDRQPHTHHQNRKQGVANEKASLLSILTMSTKFWKFKVCNSSFVTALQQLSFQTVSNY